MTDHPAIRSDSSSAQEIDALRSTVEGQDAKIRELRETLDRMNIALDDAEDALRLVLYRIQAFNLTKDTDRRNSYLADMLGATRVLPVIGQARMDGRLPTWPRRALETP